MPTNPVAAALDAITLGPAVIVSNLTTIPLLLKDSPILELDPRHSTRRHISSAPPSSTTSVSST